MFIFPAVGESSIDNSNLINEYRASLSTEQLNEYKKVKEILIRMNQFCVTQGKKKLKIDLIPAIVKTLNFILSFN